ncbi:FtsX-like permease family protein [Polystyrenella longa]|uniref:FtsX-like permease family protein n=1 Tax=Polystyrenella longa TaxID=2528007 RepID=A0A518CQZ3_9PLAN|nr:ABC transporter permease [Polystyrenella longa]QDU81652.1 FtsX-like permease family protein [Polystyrenella longa]
MKPIQLIFKELRYHRGNAFWSVMAVALTVGIFVVVAMIQSAAERETKRITRDLGFNLRIIPRDADMTQFYLTGYTDRTMPENVLKRLVAQGSVSYNHLVATLHQRVELVSGDETVSAIVTGLSEEMYPPGMKKPDMTPQIEPGTVHVGHEIANQLNLKRDDKLPVRKETFTIARVTPEMGTADDLRIVGNLADVQRALELPEQINEVKAIDCLCLTPDENPLGILRTELETILPEAKVIMLSEMAETRARQRQLMANTIRFVSPIVLLTCGAWLVALGMINARQRVSEIGLLRALGYDSGSIGILFVGKAILLGIVGALIGYYAATWLSLAYGPEMFQLTSKSLKADSQLLRRSLTVAPLFTAVCSLIPTVFAITRDPARTLRQD